MELIDQYYLHQLDEAERLEFEIRMSEDADFKAEVLKYKEGIKAIRVYGRAEMKKRLQERPLINVPEQQIKYKPQPTWYRLLKIGVPICIALGIAWWTYQHFEGQKTQDNPPLSPIKENNQQTPGIDTSGQNTPIQQADKGTNPIKNSNKGNELNVDSLFASNFEPYSDPQLEELRYRDPGSEPQYEKFLVLFLDKQYDNALKAYEQLDGDEKNTDLVLLVKANALMGTDHFGVAIPVLEKLLDSKNPAFINDARWYLALCRIKLHQISKAKVQLQKITGGSNRFNQAQGLLKTI